jgi:hypothetical protein
MPGSRHKGVAAHDRFDTGASAEGALDRIRAYLAARGVDELVALIVDLAERDPMLFRKLDLAATAAAGDTAGVEARLRQAIDWATETGGYVEYREMRDWAAGVEEVLDLLSEFGAGTDAAAGLRLAEHALARIEEALGSIADSAGHGGWLLHRAREVHLAACLAARPDPVALARALFVRELGGGYGAFANAASLYAEALGAAGLAEYRRLATEAWNALPSRGYRDRGARSVPGAWTLMPILDGLAARDGDLAARVALRRKNLSAPDAYRRLAEFCEEHGLRDEALSAAEEGLWVFADEPDERLLGFAVPRLLEDGRAAEAEAHLWRAFERRPSFELYERLQSLGGAPARDRALAWLEPRLAGAEADRWSKPADLLVRLLIEERLFDRAWEVVKAHRTSLGRRARLAAASEATHPDKALAVYAERVLALVEEGRGPGYAEAAELVARMAGLQGAGEQAAFVAGLKARFGRRRNFVKLLD